MSAFQCPTCAVRYRLTAAVSGSQVRCQGCSTVFLAPPLVMEPQPLPSALPRNVNELSYEVEESSPQVCQVSLGPEEAILVNPQSLVCWNAILELTEPAADTSLSRLSNPTRRLAECQLTGHQAGRINLIEPPRCGGTIHCRLGAFLCSSQEIGVLISEASSLGKCLQFAGKGAILIQSRGDCWPRELAGEQQLNLRADSLLAFSQGIRLTESTSGAGRTLTASGEGHIWLEAASA